MAKVRRRNAGTLHIICGLLLASAMVRLGTEVAPAFAEQATETALPDEGSTSDKLPTGALLAAFQEREARLIAREEQLEDRMQALRLAEAEISERLTALVAAEERLSATISQAERAATTDLERLKSVYENMKPREAAALFEEMPPQFAAGFLGMMRPDAAAAIMTQLPPETAYSFSVVLAGRNAQTPTQ